MFIELVDALRCVHAHEETWLVASSDRMIDRDIVRGVLGCPICHTVYPIVDGVADFTEGAPSPAAGEKSDPASEMAVRAAALLDLIEPGGFVVLAGAWTACAPELTGLVERVHVLGIDPVAGVTSGDGISLARSAGVLPLRPSTARGIALDALHATPDYVESAAAALRPGARLLAPVTAELPAALTELARDADHWLAARGPDESTVVTLKVVRR
jgi:uncharacterized protein YbaR (Trm112 family)